jgi:endonuclease/exonuclease/phosphatase family metal-dependent hydrolase
MKLISWNVNGRTGSACARQADALLSRGPDLVALQEVSATSEPDSRTRLTDAGYRVVSTVDLLDTPYVDPTIRRKYCNLIASRWTVEPLAGLDFPDATPPSPRSTSPLEARSRAAHLSSTSPICRRA